MTLSGGIIGTGAGQTIALVDTGDYTGFVNSTDPSFGSSALAVFDNEFGLPNPPSFTKYNEYGQTSPLPAPVSGWGLEITLDVEWAHAMAPGANIDLVEASNSSLPNLPIASNSAATILGASVVSQSWAYYLEYEGQGSEEQSLNATYYAPALATNPNVTFLAATGDGSANYGPIFPSVSPLNVGVGGTSLNINGDYVRQRVRLERRRRRSQRHLHATFLPAGRLGAKVTVRLPCGPSPTFPPMPIPAPECLCTTRSTTAVGCPVGGTSVATPITSATIAIADQGRVPLGGHTLGGPEPDATGSLCGL